MYRRPWLLAAVCSAYRATRQTCKALPCVKAIMPSTRWCLPSTPRYLNGTSPRGAICIASQPSAIASCVAATNTRRVCAKPARLSSHMNITGYGATTHPSKHVCTTTAISASFA
ncbi:hypothetical protein PR001_g25393 [Phytophthora rubi]|nr:hypothetical protein PR001_g25393 [Phytophthora rubi]KAE8993412.1 hypothetical protein PR002_g20252 [Phytophthora rubi]